MDNSKPTLPKVSESFRIGNRGEAFLEFIMSKHCLMHKIVGYKDIGIDYLCEWLVEDSPTRILFGIQVKSSNISSFELQPFGINKRLNGLDIFKFTKTPSWTINPNTITYWFGFEIPLYLFFVIKSNSSFDCYYQRLTPILHKKDKEKAKEEIQNYQNIELYKANDDKSEFRAIVNRQQDGGFTRDLFFDSIRCSYYTGSVKYRDSHEFGLKGWGGNNVYADILGDPECEYIENVGVSLTSLANSNIISIIPGWENQIRDLWKILHKK